MIMEIFYNTFLSSLETIIRTTICCEYEREMNMLFWRKWKIIIELMTCVLYLLSVLRSNKSCLNIW